MAGYSVQEELDELERSAEELDQYIDELEAHAHHAKYKGVAETVRAVAADVKDDSDAQELADLRQDIDQLINEYDAGNYEDDEILGQVAPIYTALVENLVYDPSDGPSGDGPGGDGPGGDGPGGDGPGGDGPDDGPGGDDPDDDPDGPAPDAGPRTIAVADMHGNYNRFTGLMDAIQDADRYEDDIQIKRFLDDNYEWDDAERDDDETYELVIAGDAIGPGPEGGDNQSDEIIDTIDYLNENSGDDEFTYLAGERELLAAFGDVAYEDWYDEDAPDDAWWNDLSDDDRNRILNWMADGTIQIAQESRLAGPGRQYVHGDWSPNANLRGIELADAARELLNAGGLNAPDDIREQVSDDLQQVYELVTTKYDELDQDWARERVTGHTPADDLPQGYRPENPQRDNYVININTFTDYEIERSPHVSVNLEGPGVEGEGGMTALNWYPDDDRVEADADYAAGEPGDVGGEGPELDENLSFNFQWQGGDVRVGNYRTTALDKANQLLNMWASDEPMDIPDVQKPDTADYLLEIFSSGGRGRASEGGGYDDLERALERLAEGDLEDGDDDAEYSVALYPAPVVPLGEGGFAGPGGRNVTNIPDLDEIDPIYLDFEIDDGEVYLESDDTVHDYLPRELLRGFSRDVGVGRSYYTPVPEEEFLESLGVEDNFVGSYAVSAGIVEKHGSFEEDKWVRSNGAPLMEPFQSYDKDMPDINLERDTVEDAVRTMWQGVWGDPEGDPAVLEAFLDSVPVYGKGRQLGRELKNSLRGQESNFFTELMVELGVSIGLADVIESGRGTGSANSYRSSPGPSVRASGSRSAAAV